jgi:DnaJ-class molecular chaperone
MEKLKDFYRILGVPRNATTDVIERAYQRLARRLHPRSGRTHDALRDVQQAYETLSDAERRQRYDETLHAPAPGEARTALRAPAGGRVLRRPALPATISGEILLSPDEARAGGSLALDLAVSTSCPSCGRTGGAALGCGRCGGDGRIDRRLPIAVRVPAGVREGAVFQLRVDEPDVSAVLLTVHITTPR